MKRLLRAFAAAVWTFILAMAAAQVLPRRRPGFAKRVAAMSAKYDQKKDSVVTAAEYVDPIPH